MIPDPDSAFLPETSPMDVLERALRNVGEEADRVSVVILHKDGCGISQFSNARSVAELIGMHELARELTKQED